LWFGEDSKVAALSKTDLRDFKEGLLNLPSNWRKKLKGLTIREAAQSNEDVGVSATGFDYLIPIGMTYRIFLQ
jgi:hypothetical protein